MVVRKDDRRGLTRAEADPASTIGRIALFRSQDDLQLAARIVDAEPSERLSVLCLPGLSRNSRDFLKLGQFLSEHPAEARRVVALDYRGRGLSDADPNWRNYTPSAEAQDVLAATAALGIERAIVVGTSRGGIIAMFLGALRPGLLAGVVLNDIGPVIETKGLARIKAYLAVKRTVGDWDAAVAACRQIAGGHFPALGDEDWRAFAEAYFAESEGGLSPQFAPNLLRAVEAIDLSGQLPESWPQFASLRGVPVLAIRGETSDLLSQRTLTLMAERHPIFERLTVPGQGHAPLLRDPPTLQRILAFAKNCETFVRPNF